MISLELQRKRRMMVKGRHRRTSKYYLFAALALSPVAAACGSVAKVAGTSTNDSVLNVAINPGFVPFEQISNGKLVGFDVDLSRALGKELGYGKVHFDEMPFTSLIAAVTSHRDDVAISGILDTPAREQEVSFSTPYIRDAFVLAVDASNTTVHGLADLAHSTIAVQVGTIPAQFVRDRLPNATIVTTQDTPSAFQLVAEGRATATVTDGPVADYYVKQLGGKLRVLSQPLNQAEPIGVVMPKGSSLVSRVNSALSKLNSDGILPALREKWLGTSATSTSG